MCTVHRGIERRLLLWLCGSSSGGCQWRLYDDVDVVLLLIQLRRHYLSLWRHDSSEWRECECGCGVCVSESVIEKDGGDGKKGRGREGDTERERERGRQKERERGSIKLTSND